MQSQVPAAGAGAAPTRTPVQEVRLTIRRIRAGLNLLDGPEKAYAESLVQSLSNLLPVPSETHNPSVPLHEREEVMRQIRQILRPLVRPGEMLIWREPWRWKNEHGALANHYESLDIEDLCLGFGYELVHHLTHLAIVRPGGGTAPSWPSELPR